MQEKPVWDKRIVEMCPPFVSIEASWLLSCWGDSGHCLPGHVPELGVLRLLSLCSPVTLRHAS